MIAIAAIAARAWSGPADDTARIGLTYFGSPNHVVLTCAGGLGPIRTGSGATLKCDLAQSATVDAAKAALTVTLDAGPIDVGTSVTIAPADPAGIITIEAPGRSARKYRGSIEVDLTGEATRLINVVNIEDYLLGVLPSEMPESYPVEALKAQAIAARTYLPANRNKHASQGFDVCDSTHCQTYGGVLAEKAGTTTAVMATRGQVLVYDGRPASVMYSTDCGGVTRNYSDIQPVPYLRSVTEPEDIRHITWQESFALGDLEKKLLKAGVKEAAGLKSVAVATTDTSGRALDLTITGSSASKTIPVSALRSALGADLIKSALFTIDPAADGSITIKGRGWGHGVGLCQVGAKGLALAPHNLTCDQILAHYFPGTQLSSGVPPITPGADVAMIPGSVGNSTPGAGDPRRSCVSGKKPPKEPFDVRVRDPWDF